MSLYLKSVFELAKGQKPRLNSGLINEYFRVVYEYVLSPNLVLRRAINAASARRLLHRRLLRFVNGQFGPDAVSK